MIRPPQYQSVQPQPIYGADVFGNLDPTCPSKHWLPQLLTTLVIIGACIIAIVVILAIPGLNILFIGWLLHEAYKKIFHKKSQQSQARTNCDLDTNPSSAEMIAALQHRQNEMQAIYYENDESELDETVNYYRLDKKSELR